MRLVALRPVFRQRDGFVVTAAADIRCNTHIFVQDLHRCRRRTHFDQFMHEVVRQAVEVAVEGNRCPLSPAAIGSARMPPGAAASTPDDQALRRRWPGYLRVCGTDDDSTAPAVRRSRDRERQGKSFTRLSLNLQTAASNSVSTRLQKRKEPIAPGCKSNTTDRCNTRKSPMTRASC